MHFSTLHDNGPVHSMKKPAPPLLELFRRQQMSDYTTLCAYLFIAYSLSVLSIYLLLLPGEIVITLKLALEFMKKKHNYLFLD